MWRFSDLDGLRVYDRDGVCRGLFAFYEWGKALDHADIIGGRVRPYHFPATVQQADLGGAIVAWRRLGATNLVIRAKRGKRGAPTWLCDVIRWGS